MIRFRFPVLEVFAALHGDALARRGRVLTDAERETLREVFGEAVNLDEVRIVEARVANAPTTLGNTIRIRPGSHMTPDVLVHEVAHVWQFQTKGTSYVSDSALHQGLSLVRTGSRASAYDVAIVPGRPMDEYTAEQQAMIIENQFCYPEWREHPEVRRLMEQVRATRPATMDAILHDAFFGPAPPEQALDAEGRPVPVPLFRIDL